MENEQQVPSRDAPGPTTGGAVPKRRRWPVRCLAALVCFVVLVGPWHAAWFDRLGGAGNLASPGIARAPKNQPASNRTGPLRAGAAKIDLTDGVTGLPLAGYIGRVFEPSKGITDPVAVRALVLDNGMRRVAVVSAELLIVNRLLADEVLERLSQAGWRREEVYFSATHTHSSAGCYAGTWVETLGLGWSRPDVVALLADRIAEAVGSAARSCVDAEFAASAVQVDASLVRNRTVDGGPTNRWLDVLSFRRADDRQSLATIVVFAAHPTCRHSDDPRLSGDYPGVLQRQMEHEWGGVALFLAGGVGSMAPPRDRWPRDELADKLGSELARQAIGSLRSLEGFERTVPVETLGAVIDLPAPRVKLSSRWRLSPVLASRLLPTSTWLHGLRIGDRVLLGTPADYSGVLAEELRTAVNGVTAIVTSFNGDYVGYILPEAYDDLPGYEPRSMSFYGPQLGRRCNQALTAIAKALARP